MPLGPVGLALGAALGAWLEWALLRGRLGRRIGTVGAGASALARMFIAALIAAGAGYAVRFGTAELHPILIAAAVVAVFGLVYFALASAFRLEEARTLLNGIRRRLLRR
jgi:putative peptidoglycan lipid II flippase